MLPTIKVGDTVISDEYYYSKNSIHRFDIVVFKAQLGLDESETKYVKRVIGLPNETIEIKKGKVFINGKFLNEPFQFIPDTMDFGPITIPPKEYFLMGDNRGNSSDSRFWKKPTMEESNILGRIVEIKPK